MTLNKRCQVTSLTSGGTSPNKLLSSHISKYINSKSKHTSSLEITNISHIFSRLRINNFLWHSKHAFEIRIYFLPTLVSH